MKIKYLVVHCSDSLQNRGDIAETIHRWHKGKFPPWAGIGYHAVILEDGSIQMGRPHYWKGAHVRRHNSVSLGVCLIGRDTFSDDQLKSLRKQLHEWLKIYPSSKIVGHCDLDSKKTCPNFDVDKWWRYR